MAKPIAPAPAVAPAPADRWTYFWVVVVGLAAVGLLGSLVMSYGKPVDTSKATSAAGVLALVTALAVGIERVLEAFWTLIDRLLKNPSLPFSSDAALLDRLASQLGASVKQPLEDTAAFLNGGDAAATKLIAAKPKVKDQVDQMLNSVNDILGGQKDPKSWDRIDALQAGLVDLDRQLKSQGVDRGLALSKDALDAMSGWIDSLLTNPGRKIMSLFAGALVGLAVAWTFGLDLVHAALSVSPPAGLAWGMAVTGVVVGLGSNPTHELINLIQTYKQNSQR